MDSQWSMIWTRSNGVAAKAGRKRDAFADPLDRPEWDGLRWSIALAAWLVGGSGGQPQKEQKNKQVERFTGAGASKAVCVS